MKTTLADWSKAPGGINWKETLEKRPEEI